MSATGVLPQPDDITFKSYKEMQLSLVEKLLEEVLEFKVSLEEGDIVNSVKEMTDIKFVFTQCEITAEQAGVDVQEAEELVCLNNELKYTEIEFFAEEWAEGIGLDKVYVDKNVDEDGEEQYCIKDKVTHKVKKFKDFPKIDLSPCVPKYLTNYADVHDCKLPTGNMFEDIKTFQEYNELVSTGMAWVIYKDLPFSWEQFVCERVKYNLEKGENV